MSRSGRRGEHKAEQPQAFATTTKKAGYAHGDHARSNSGCGRRSAASGCRRRAIDAPTLRTRRGDEDLVRALSVRALLLLHLAPELRPPLDVLRGHPLSENHDSRVI